MTTHIHDHIDVRGRGGREVRTSGPLGELAYVPSLARECQWGFVGTGEGEEVVDDPAHAHDLLAGAGQDRARIVVDRVVAQADVELHANRGQGRAQLVGGVGDQSLPRVDAMLEAVEHRVQCAPEVVELVVDARRGDSLGKLIETDLVGAPSHPLDRSQRLAGDPPAAEGDHRTGGTTAGQQQHEDARGRVVDLQEGLGDDYHLPPVPAPDTHGDDA